MTLIRHKTGILACLLAFTFLLGFQQHAVSSTTLASDSFSRTLTGSWGNADTGGTYTLAGTAMDFKVNGSAGTITSAAGATHSAYLYGIAAVDADARFRVQTDKLAAGGGEMTYLIARRAKTGNDYEGRLRFASDGSIRLQIVKEVGGIATLLGPEVAVSGLTHVANKYFWLRMQVTGTNPTAIRLRAWADGQTEPTAWMVSITDSTAGLQTAGAVGLRSYLAATVTNAPVVFSVDNLLVTNPSTVPAFDHIFIVIEENHAYNEIIGNAAAPYINTLAKQYSLATNYVAVAHPSLPNYLALTGGGTFGVTTDCSPSTCPINAVNIADRLEAAGKTWKAYMESMPAPCKTLDTGSYAVRHDPFVYYDDIRTNQDRCTNHVVPYTVLANDLSATSTTPNYVWITPNLCDDMHDCSVSTGDTWLQNNLPMIFKSLAWTSQNSLLLIVWDEDDGSSGNHVAALVISPAAKAGYQSTVAYNHYSLLRTVEASWELPSLTSNDGTAAPLGDFWH